MKKKSNEVYIGPRVWIKCKKHANGKPYGFSIESTNLYYKPMYFTKAQARELFKGIKRVFEEVLPRRRVNPWSDSPHGTPDFE